MIRIILAGTCLVLIIVKLTKRPDKFPPGPRGVPLLGCIPFIRKLDRLPHIAMIKLSQKYGSVVGFYLASQPFVSVVGYTAAREALMNEKLAARPDNYGLRLRDDGVRRGLMFWDGENWREQRRFTLRHLRDLGFGRTSLEGLMHEEIQDLMADMKRLIHDSDQGIINFKGFFQASVINVLWAIVAGIRYKRDDERLQKLFNALEGVFRSGEPVVGSATSKLLDKLLYKYIVGNRQILLFTKLNEFLNEIIEEHKKTISNEPRDFLDVYINEMQTHGKNKPSYSQKQLVASVRDLFAAGSESTSNSIGFAIVHMMLNPEVQRKIQDELENVCPNRLPSLTDRTNLPFTEAVLMEIQRMSSIAPLTVPHYASEDTILQGYRIPKGAVVSVNLYSVHMDKEYWGDPETFRPERHLSSTGEVIRNEHLMFFGMGKRACLGEALAKNTLFLFFTSLVHNFTFSVVPGEEKPSLDPLPGFTIAPQPFSALVTSRK